MQCREVVKKIPVNAKHMCITAMKEYQDKSLEELRVEDYLLNKKSGTQGTSGLFGSGVKPLTFATPTATTAPLFGASATQTQAKPLFGGGTSLFGASQPTGTFGQTTQSSLFGGKPLFGASNTTANVFGSSTTAQNQLGLTFGQASQSQGSIFGSKPAFGATTTAPSFGIFGSQPAQSASPGFGFGKTQTTGLFGSAPASNSLFGATQPASQASPFGAVANQSTGLFGGIRPTTATSIFGSTTTTAPTAFGFGSAFGVKPAASTGLFGNTLTSNPLAAKPTGFGFPTTQATPGFGLPSTATSAAQSGLGGGLFGAKKPLFGANTTTATPGFGFGAATASTGLFGNALGATSQAAQPSTGLFGNTLGLGSNTGSLFGPQAAATGIGGTSFRQPTPPFSFNAAGSTSSSLFGAGTSTAGGTGSLFGGLFGASSGAFGGTTTTPALGSSFGSSALATNAAALGPLVEQITQNARAQQHVLDLVRSMPYGQSALFRHLDAFNEAQSSASSRSTTVSSTSSKSSVGTVLSGQAMSSVLADRHKAAGLVVGSPMRLTPTVARSFSRRPLNQFPLNRSQLFTGFHEEDALVSAQSPNVGESGDVSSSSAPVGSLFIRRDAWKRLKIPENIRTSTIERSTVALSEMSGRSEASDFLPVTSEAVKVSIRGDTLGEETTKTPSSTAPRVQFLDATSPTPLPTRNLDQHKSTEPSPRQMSPGRETSARHMNATSQPSVEQSPLPTNSRTAVDATNVPHRDLDATWSLPPDATLGETVLAEADGDSSDDDERARRPGGIKLTKPGYYIFPTVEELSELVDEDGRCVVQNFIIGRQSYGHILFPGLTDITGIDFNDVVHIRRREVVVYPDDSTKPPVGYGLNRKAEVTLDGIWPADKSTREFIKSPQRLAAMHFDERLEKATQKMNATFIEYRPDTGSWVFEVKHFSKYRLEDSDEDSSDQPPASRPESETNKTRGLSQPLQHDNIALSTAPRTYIQSFDNLEQFSFADTSLWTSQAYPSDFRKAQDSLLLRKYGSLGEDILGVDDYDEVMFTAASGGHFTQNLPEGLPDMKKSSQFPLNTDTLHTSYMDNLPITKRSPGSYTKGGALHSNTTITPFRISFQVPASRVESLHGIHNPMASLTRLRARKNGLIAEDDDDFPMSRFSVPYKEITALLGDDSFSSAAHLELCRLFFDAGLSAGGSCRVSWSFAREPNEQYQLVVSRQEIDLRAFGVDPYVSIPAMTPSSGSVMVITSLKSQMGSEEEVLLVSALQTSQQSPDEALDGDHSFCPLLLPNPGLSVLESYLASRDLAESAADQDSPQFSRLAAFYRGVEMCHALWGRHRLGDPDFNKTVGQVSAVAPLASAVEQGGDVEMGSSVAGNRHRDLSNFSLEDLARKQAVSKWIRDQLRPWMLFRMKELGLSNLLEFTQSQDTEPIAKLRDLWSAGAQFSRQNLFEGIFGCLCCGETGLACRIAVAGQLPSMAIVLSQAPNGDPQFKHDILRQLQTWHELKMDRRIPKVMLSTYALLAGQIHLPHPDYAEEVLDVLEGVSYLQALGVHLWYLTDYTTGLSGALKLFSHNWHSVTTAVAPPCPPTATDLQTVGKSRFAATAIGLMQPRAVKSRDWPRDVAYHLLRLKCRRWHSLERTLDPTSFWLRQGDCLNRNTPALSDWSASWHLWRVLHALGYRQLNPLATSRLHSEFACQLESSGLWHWAIFVLLHEQDPRVRASSVKQVIGRHVSLQPRAVLSQGKDDFFHLDDPGAVDAAFTKTETFLIEQLHVPKRWLHEAKACLARSRLAGLPFSARARRRRHLFASLEAAHWLAAGHVDAAHDVCLHHLLPDFILHSESAATLLPTSANYGKSKASGILASRLLSVLQPFIQLPPEKSPSSFNTGAGVYVAYGRVLYLINQLSAIAQPSTDPSETSDGPTSLAETLVQLENSCQELCEFLRSMTVNSVHERVVKSEIAAVAVSLLSAFVKQHHSEGQFDASPPMSPTAEELYDRTDYLKTLRRHVNLISQLGLPTEKKMRELESQFALSVCRSQLS
uniref:Nuclear pore complex protein Nup98-Nup96 n=1 Tax=Schistocephalus solidus TaxID=70667 RepID=A0A0X3NVG3_SCHSO